MRVGWAFIRVYYTFLESLNFFLAVSYQIRHLADMPSKNRKTKLLTVWLKPADIADVDRAARMLDLDRSKLVRSAIREKLSRLPKLAREAA
jgi:hypothetical protein